MARTGRRTGLAPSRVVASVTVGLEEFIERQGGRSGEVLARAGLQPGLYRQPNRPIALRSYCRSMHEAARSTGNEHFGLSFGEQFAPEGLGLYGYAAITAPDLRTAIGHMERFFPVFQDNSLLKFGRQDGLCALEYRLLDGDIPDRRQDAEVTIGMINNVLRRALGPGWAPEAVHFQHPALVQRGPHRDAFQCEVRFDQPSNCILLREECLDRPMPDADPMLHNVALGTLQDLLGQTASLLSLTRRTRDAIVERLPQGGASLDEVARALALSPRSLQRQLADEGSSFASLLEDVRQQLAEHYLCQERMSVSDVAWRLGYSEVSAFSRAFARWKRLSPSGWARQPMSQ